MRWFFLCWVAFASHAYSYQYDLAICAIFRNEGPYLREWIEYHRLLGVEHFYLYNHKSTDEFIPILTPYIAKGIVELKHAHSKRKTGHPPLVGFNAIQVDSYNRCLVKARGVSKWVAFIDLDEFILPSDPVDLPTFLSHYASYAGLVINWRCFGTSHLQRMNKKRPMIEQLICCSDPNLPINAHVKSIVRPELVDHFCNPHYAIYLPGCVAVDAHFEPQAGPLSAIKHDLIRINHYWTRDEYYFENWKIPVRRAWGLPEEGCRRLNADLNVETDGLILRHVPKLRSRLRKISKEQRS